MLASPAKHARRWDEAGWFDRRLGGKGGRLEEAQQIAREKGLSEAARRGPEKFRPNRGDAAEGGEGDASFDFGK